jgi:predicted enzyme related to lactoylglutathione lyase
MARVTGIGGFFFGSRDPDALNRWYARHFGIVMVESRSYDDPGLFQERGEIVFAAFVQDWEAFGGPERTWKINLRLSDLDGMVDRLRAAGVAVQPHAERYPNGRFAELEDPEGNRIQLWEPNAASIARDGGGVERPERGGG